MSIAKKPWWMEKDKILHFSGGFLAAFFIALFIGRFWAFVSVTFVGFIKEEYDRRHPKKHTEEARDALATSLGGFMGAILGDELTLIIWGLL